MAKLPPIGDVVKRALTMIQPAAETADACVADIRKAVEMLHQLVAMRPPPPGTLKDELQDIHTQLVKTKEVLRRSRVARALVFFATFPSQIPPADLNTGSPATRPLFLDLLDQLIDAAEFSRDSLVVPPGSKPWDIVKAQSVRQAKRLLAHGPDKPKRGVADKLASLLYEAVTGETGVNLRQYRRAGDQAKPSIVMRVAPRKRKR
jgi:hypothetical protein